MIDGPLSVTHRRFKPYPAYKDAGVEWLGEIPAHWDLKRLKNCVQRLESGGTPESDNPEYWTDDESGIPWVAISDMTRSFRVCDTAKRLTEHGLQSKRLPVLRAGTLLYSMYASLGKVALLEIDAVVNQAILGLVTRDALASRDYLRWWLEFMQGHVQMLSSSNTQDNLNADKVRKMPVFVPPPGEQPSIAAFLDRETAGIEALVAKKERLIELLQEKRTALITGAVTKGLDPNVPLKDSGVEWLGQIPAHWRALALKRIGDLQGGAGFPDNEQGVTTEDIPFFKVGDMAVPGNEREMRECQHTVSEVTARRLRAFVFPPGTIVFAKVGAALMLNRRRILTRRSCLDNNMMGFMPGDCDSAWAMHWLSGLDMGELANPGAVPSVNEGQMRETPSAVPPIPEQCAIAAFLDGETSKIDTLLAKVREAIDRLKELRTALISAAVTGKIDVRRSADG